MNKLCTYCKENDDIVQATYQSDYSDDYLCDTCYHDEIYEANEYYTDDINKQYMNAMYYRDCCVA